jgi:hypothetical protein
MNHRWEQKLAGPIDINDLVSEFVRKIQGIGGDDDMLEAKVDGRMG